MIMVIGKDKVVTVSYQLFSLDENGDALLIDEMTVDNPLEFIFGDGFLLPLLEEKLKGQSRGYHMTLDLHPRDAFGLHHPDLVTWMPKEKFPKEMDIKLGMKFQTQGPTGDLISVIVKEIKDSQVLIDGNHPLAGLHLRFDLKVLRVREASEKEIMEKKVNTNHLH